MSICAGVVVRNEAPFLRQSVCSIAPFVDKVILVENGSVDGSGLICDELSNNISNVIAIHLGLDASLASARNVIDDLADEGWIIWWDADFIAYTDDDGDVRSFSRMIELLHEAPPSQNQILYGGPNVGPTFDAVKSDKSHHGNDGDVQITKKGLMRFRVDKYIDTRYYTRDCITKYVCSPEFQYFLHLDKVKPLTRLALRANLYDFEARQFSRSPNDRQDLLEFMYESNKTFSIANILGELAKSLVQKSVPFDFDRYGPHPGIIGDLVADPFYSIVSDDDSGLRTLHTLRSFTRNDQIYLKPYFLTGKSLRRSVGGETATVLAPSRRMAFLKDATIDGMPNLDFDTDEIARFVWVGTSFCVVLNNLAGGDFLRIGLATDQPDVCVYVTPLDDGRFDTVTVRLPTSGVHAIVANVGWASQVEIRLVRPSRPTSNFSKFKIYYLAKTSSPTSPIEIFSKTLYVTLPDTVPFVEALQSANS